MDYFGESIDVEFEKATNFVRTAKFNTTQEQKLKFYGYFKQATQGACSDPQPGFFDFEGKAKWGAWKELGRMEKFTAKKLYIDSLTALVPGWKGGNTATTNATKESWKAVSAMKVEDIEIAESDKTICDLVSEDRETTIIALLAKDKTLANFQDENGSSPLHFAADKGSLSLCKLLLENGAEVSIKDSEGQTPLHYACLCEHDEVVSLLIAKGADPHDKDNSGDTPYDLAEEACKSALIRLNLTHYFDCF